MKHLSTSIPQILTHSLEQPDNDVEVQISLHIRSLEVFLYVCTRYELFFVVWKKKHISHAASSMCKAGMQNAVIQLFEIWCVASFCVVYY